MAEYSLLLISVVTYMETRLREGYEREELERIAGFSYRHIREVFREKRGVSLGRYVLSRRLAWAAFEIAHTERSLTEIAQDWRFDSYDTFTRAFRRETGLSPSAFRKGSYQVGRQILTAGIFAPAILRREGRLLSAAERKEKMNMKEQIKGDDMGLLLGVPKVEYTWGECTPFPSCLKACLNYMGQSMGYAHLMAASGAAFRLRWNTTMWDGGNVDITYIYPTMLEAFAKSFAAAGRKWKYLRREDSDKQGFIDFIKAEIDEGRPVIALGIIGPPEACIVTGYQKGGEELLGWNFFQSRAEFASGIRFHESGYFISDNWWDNPGTLMLMAVEEQAGEATGDREIMRNGLEILRGETLIFEGYDHIIACGQYAFRCWADWLEDDKKFGSDLILPLLFERYMCHTDAITMVGEGRSYGAIYLKALGERQPELAPLCGKIADLFGREAALCNQDMMKLHEGKDHEETVRNFGKPEVRKTLAGLIRKAAKLEDEATALVEELFAKM